MPETLGLTVIGHQGTGKTCFLYAMYAQMAFGINGFTFMPDDFDLGLQLEEGWRKLVEEGTWPQGTDDFRNFQFECSYAFEPMFNFLWHDYKGGLLVEPKSNEREKLFDQIEKSSSILLFIEAETIKGLLMNSHKAISRLRIINQIISFYRKEQDPIPVALTITKRIF